MSFLMLDHDIADRLIALLGAVQSSSTDCPGCHGPHQPNAECELHVVQTVLRALHDDAFGAHAADGSHPDFAEASA